MHRYYKLHLPLPHISHEKSDYCELCKLDEITEFNAYEMTLLEINGYFCDEINNFYAIYIIDINNSCENTFYSNLCIKLMVLIREDKILEILL